MNVHAKQFAFTSNGYVRDRIQAANSTPLEALVVALDRMSAELGGILARENWQHTHTAGFNEMIIPSSHWRNAVGEAEIDLVVMVGTAGQDLSHAQEIADAYRGRAKLSAILFAADGLKSKGLSRALLQLRPCARTLAVLSEVDILPAALRALGI